MQPNNWVVNVDIFHLNHFYYLIFFAVFVSIQTERPVYRFISPFLWLRVMACYSMEFVDIVKEWILFVR